MIVSCRTGAVVLGAPSSALVDGAEQQLDAVGWIGVRPRRILVDQVSLVVQLGPERRWDWEPVDTAVLGGR